MKYLLLFLPLHFLSRAVAYTPTPRWGSACTLIHNTLLVQGGKTLPENGYIAGTNVNDLLSLDLSNAFDVSNPPWQYVSGSANSSSNSDSAGPAVAFHTLTPISPTSILLFGGDGGPSLSHPVGKDSAWLLDISNMVQPTWNQLPSDENGEPARVENQAAATSNGTAWIIGGQKPDGSGPATNSYQYSSQSTPPFTPLPTSSAPTSLSGHAAVALSNGTILVFGGQSPDMGGMLPMDTIYALDTSVTPPVWSSFQTQGTAPASRRNFAAVVVTGQNGDHVFIQGGAADTSSPPQTFLSDGFILDTTKSPMAWSSVENVSQLGERAAHIAITQGDLVLFAFGWAPGENADTGVRVFNTTSQSFVSSWTPPVDPSTPSSTADGTSNPFPSATPGSSAGAPHSGSSTASPSPTNSTPPLTPNPNANASQHSLVVALAVVFGVLALIAVAGGSTYVAIKRREEANGGAFHLMDEDKDAEGGGAGGGGANEISPHTNAPPEKTHLVGTQQRPSVSPWAFVSGALLGGARRTKDRVDMLADEDQPEYDVQAFRAIPGRRPSAPTRGYSGHSVGSSISNWYGGPGGSRRNWTGWVGQSFSSLKNVSGAMMGANREATTHTAETVESGIPWWDQDAVPLDPFGDDMAMREQPEIGATALATNNVSGIAAVGVGAAARPRGGVHTSSGSYPYVPPTEMGEHPNSVRLVNPSQSTHSAEPSSSSITPLQPVTTHGTLSSNDHSSSGPSGSSLATPPTGLHTTSIIGAAGAVSAPIRRSDSWWTRFSKASLLERRTSPPTSPRQSQADHLLDFRDPHPAPKLVPIKESSGGSAASPEGSANSDLARRRRSMSSVETGRTADSEGIAGMATMDVVQRQGTSTSHGTASSLMENDADDERSRNSQSSNNLLGADVTLSPLEEPRAPSLQTTNSNSSGELSSGGGSVADRIQGWERRQSQESPQPYRRERRSTYGLAPRASMFVANPDEGSKQQNP